METLTTTQKSPSLLGGVVIIGGTFVLMYWYSAIHNKAVALFFTGEKPSWQH